MFNVILESFGALVSKWPVQMKTAKSEIWESWVVVIYLWDIFDLLVLCILSTCDLLVFKVIWGSFGHMSQTGC